MVLQYCIRTYSMGVRRTIKNLWPLMESDLSVKISNGNKTKFWHDGWSDQSPLKEQFPYLFRNCGGTEARTSAGQYRDVNSVLGKHNKDGNFSVSSAYKRGLHPTKVKCFTWLVIKRACLTRKLLQKNGRQLGSRCFFCNTIGEANKHLFLRCSVAA